MFDLNLEILNENFEFIKSYEFTSRIPEYFNQVYMKMYSEKINAEIEELSYSLKRIDVYIESFGVLSVENSSQSELNSDVDEPEIMQKRKK
jgi:hypothetical protein